MCPSPAPKLLETGGSILQLVLKFLFNVRHNALVLVGNNMHLVNTCQNKPLTADDVPLRRQEKFESFIQILTIMFKKLI